MRKEYENYEKFYNNHADIVYGIITSCITDTASVDEIFEKVIRALYNQSKPRKDDIEFEKRLAVSLSYKEVLQSLSATFTRPVAMKLLKDKVQIARLPHSAV